MMSEGFDARLGQIETRLGEIGRLFERFSEMMERMVSLEEKDRHAERRIDIAERAIYDMNQRLDVRFEKQDLRYEAKFDKVYEAVAKLGDQLQHNTVKVLILWGILSFVGAVGAVFLKEFLGKIF